MENKAFQQELEGADSTQIGDVVPRNIREVTSEKRRIYKNVLLISISFLLLFVAFESMSKLQSSINTVDNLGLWSSVVVYASLILSCLLLPSFIISLLSVKWTLVVCVFCYSLYMAAQFRPLPLTLLPSACLLGLGAAPLWSAKCAYLTQAARRFAQLDNASPETVVARFFGIFFFFFQCNSIIGNVISTAVLSSGTNFPELSDEEMAHCGASFCASAASVDQDQEGNGTVETELTNVNFKTDITKIYLMAGIYLACSIAAGLLIAFFVDPLRIFLSGSQQEQDQEQEKDLSGLQLLVATLHHLRKKKQLLIVPITFWSGVEQGFFGADFTAVSSSLAETFLNPIISGFCDLRLWSAHCRPGVHPLWCLQRPLFHQFWFHPQFPRSSLSPHPGGHYQPLCHHHPSFLDPVNLRPSRILPADRPLGGGGCHLANPDHHPLRLPLPRPGAGRLLKLQAVGVAWLPLYLYHQRHVFPKIVLMLVSLILGMSVYLVLKVGEKRKYIKSYANYDIQMHRQSNHTKPLVSSKVCYPGLSQNCKAYTNAFDIRSFFICVAKM